MPRGGGRGKKNYKGQRRHFTDEEELARQMKEEEKKKNWRKKEGEDSDEGGASKAAGDSGSDSDSESSSDEEGKPKGVSHLIAIENPNRAKKQAKKVTEIDSGAKINLSRREREELEKQQARARYQELHMQGKTDEAQADLARLAIIRKQREDAAKKREEEKKAKEEAAAAKSKS